jgi:hypothetical protein
MALLYNAKKAKQLRELLPVVKNDADGVLRYKKIKKIGKGSFGEVFLG